MEGSKAELGGGGSYVNMQDKSYDVILNVLLGVRRGLGDLSSSNLIPKVLDYHQFQKWLCMETDWTTSKAQQRSTYKFYEYAPMAFQKIRSLSGIDEEDYIMSMGPE